MASGDARLPSDDLTDWVSYADAVVAVTITDEREIAVTPEEAAREEGYVPREVTASVDGSLWQHPQASATPESFTYLAEGWALRDGERRPIVFENAVREEVGESYVVAITRFDDVLAPIGPHGLLRLDESGLTADDRVSQVPELAGRTPEEIADALAETVPDPVAEANRHLSAEERYAAVQAGRDSAP